MNAFKNQFKSAFILYFFLFAIFFLSFYFQQHMLFNRDVSWLLEASKRLFLGGDYTHNFYENNPPWILYFYLPPVLLHYYTALNLFLALQWYVLLLTGCSLLLCWPFLSKIFSEDKSLKHIFLLTLSIIFFVGTYQ